MEFIDPKLNEYAELFSADEPEVLKKLNRETHAKVLMPRMLSGHLQGRILSMLSHMIQPKFILEIGTYTGYSAICLAEGLQNNGKIVSMDINEELEGLIHSHWNEAGISEKAELRIGNAIDLIPQINQPLDLVFIDADKENYSNYYDLVIDKLRSGGIIIADNVLWSGKVLDLKKNSDKETSSIHQFNEKIKNDPRVENILMPVRDGLNIIRKL